MDGDLHVRAEPQEVAPIGLLILVAIWDDADAAYGQHGLQGTGDLEPATARNPHPHALCS